MSSASTFHGDLKGRSGTTVMGSWDLGDGDVRAKLCLQKALPKRFRCGQAEAVEYKRSMQKSDAATELLSKFSEGCDVTK